MKKFSFGNNLSPVKSDLRAVVSQVSHTRKMKKSATVENIISFGSGVVASHSSRSVEKMESYLQQAVSEGYLHFESGSYSITDSGHNLIVGGDTGLPEIDSFRTAKQRRDYGRAMKHTRLAVGTRPTYLS